MDATDYRILNLLQADARMTLREIGERVNLTPPSVSERIHKLEDEGVIAGYHIAVDRSKLGYAVGGYILASPEPGKYAAFCAFCEKEAVETTENWCTLPIWRATSLSHRRYPSLQPVMA